MTKERDDLRKIFFESWRKYKNTFPLEPLEAKIIDIILLHPEYHALLDNPDHFQQYDFDEGNPFLHLSLHLALHEQITTNRPKGIKAIYSTLYKKFNDKQKAEHAMMDCLAQILWNAQETGGMPDENTYLMHLKKL